MQPLASSGNARSQANTNLSTTVSFSILDQNGNDISIETIDDQSIELIIPRDPNLVIPPMIFQNLTITGEHNQSFYLYSTNFTRTNNLSISFHFQMHPFNLDLAYLFIYNFDRAPLLNRSINQTDGWTSFCPSGMCFFRYHYHFFVEILFRFIP